MNYSDTQFIGLLPCCFGRENLLGMEGSFEDRSPFSFTLSLFLLPPCFVLRITAKLPRERGKKTDYIQRLLLFCFICSEVTSPMKGVVNLPGKSNTSQTQGPRFCRRSADHWASMQTCPTPRTLPAGRNAIPAEDICTGLSQSIGIFTKCSQKPLRLSQYLHLAHFAYQVRSKLPSLFI